MREETSSIIARKIERIRQGGNPRVLDLFAGAGGLSLGFLTAGFEIVAAVEIDPHASKTHAINFFKSSTEETRSIHARPRDITQVEPDDLMREYGFNEPQEAVDVIIGGPPCQAFARVGRAKLREVANHPEAFLQDPRANLYLRFIHYVEQLKPLAILMENVPDALNHGGHNIAEETCEVLSSNGHQYKCAYTMLNSAYYGVPQMRERMILIAYKEELGQLVSFPEPTHFINLPGGYQGTRGVALRSLRTINTGQQQLFTDQAETLPRGIDTNYYQPAPIAKAELPGAITAETALGDLPKIFALDLLKQNLLKKGVTDPAQPIQYPQNVYVSPYGNLMRHWRGFETKETVTGHVIRYLPRDYKLFARLKPGDQYPQAYECAISMFMEELESNLRSGKYSSLPSIEIERRLRSGEELPDDSGWVQYIWKEFVPPYSPDKFPNKWRKMEANLPARTLMAHIGKDSYSHIHYDSSQARTISVREAARIMSFPDGFIFYGKMNAAFKQAGNAVAPLFAYRLAAKIKEAFGQKAMPLMAGE